MTTHKTDAVKSGLMPDYSLAGVVLSRTGMIIFDAQDELISGDTIQLVPIPKNAQILDIWVSAMVKAGTLDFAGATGCHVGDGASPSRFMDDASLGAKGTLTMLTSTSKPSQIGYCYDEGEDTIDLALTKAATVNQTDLIIKCTVFYKMAGSIKDEDFKDYDSTAA